MAYSFFDGENVLYNVYYVNKSAFHAIFVQFVPKTSGKEKSVVVCKGKEASNNMVGKFVLIFLMTVLSCVEDKCAVREVVVPYQYEEYKTILEPDENVVSATEEGYFAGDFIGGIQNSTQGYDNSNERYEIKYARYDSEEWEYTYTTGKTHMVVNYPMDNGLVLVTSSESGYGTDTYVFKEDGTTTRIFSTKTSSFPNVYITDEYIILWVTEITGNKKTGEVWFYDRENLEGEQRFCFESEYDERTEKSTGEGIRYVCANDKYIYLVINNADNEISYLTRDMTIYQYDIASGEVINSASVHGYIRHIAAIENEAFIWLNENAFPLSHSGFIVDISGENTHYIEMLENMDAGNHVYESEIQDNNMLFFHSRGMYIYDYENKVVYRMECSGGDKCTAVCGGNFYCVNTREDGIYVRKIGSFCIDSAAWHEEKTN